MTKKKNGQQLEKEPVTKILIDEPLTKPKIRNAWVRSSEEIQEGAEVNFLPSKTIPDDALTVNDLLDRHKRGLPLDGDKRAIYAGMDVELPNLKKMDLSEIAEFKRETDAKMEEYKKAVEEQNKKQAEAEAAKLSELELLKKSFLELKEKYEKQSPSKKES